MSFWESLLGFFTDEKTRDVITMAGGALATAATVAGVWWIRQDAYKKGREEGRRDISQAHAKKLREEIDRLMIELEQLKEVNKEYKKQREAAQALAEKAITKAEALQIVVDGLKEKGEEVAPDIRAALNRLQEWNAQHTKAEAA